MSDSLVCFDTPPAFLVGYWWAALGGISLPLFDRAVVMRVVRDYERAEYDRRMQENLRMLGRASEIWR